MAVARPLIAGLLVGLAVAACGKSDSTQHVGYRGYTVGKGPPPHRGDISPPSSGTSNGTGEALPPAAMAKLMPSSRGMSSTAQAGPPGANSELNPPSSGTSTGAPRSAVPCTLPDFLASVCRQ